MKVANRVYAQVEVRYAKTPEFEPEVKVEDGTVYVKARRDDGALLWIPAKDLMTDREAKVKVFERVINILWNLAFCDLGLTKAEMKRRLIAASIISK